MNRDEADGYGSSSGYGVVLGGLAMVVVGLLAWWVFG